MYTTLCSNHQPEGQGKPILKSGWLSSHFWASRELLEIKIGSRGYISVQVVEQKMVFWLFSRFFSKILVEAKGYKIKIKTYHLFKVNLSDLQQHNLSQIILQKTKSMDEILLEVENMIKLISHDQHQHPMPPSASSTIC